MSATRHLHLCALIGIASAAITQHACGVGAETVAPAQRPRVVIVPDVVAVDGKSRPDIAQALSDSFSAGLLKTGDYRVFQADIPQPKQGKNKKGDVMLGSASAGGAKIPADVDIKFTFNLVGEEDDYRFTLKKIRVTDSEVLEVHEIETHGKLDKVFGMVPNVLMKMQAKVKHKPVFPMTQSPAQLAARPLPVSYPSSASYAGTGASAASEFAHIDFTKVPKALIYQQVGSVQFINEAWKFAIIRPQSDVKLKMSDALHVLYDEDGKIYADLKIANFDSGRVIADFGNRTPVYHKIFPGDEVFGWAPPAR